MHIYACSHCSAIILRDRPTHTVNKFCNAQCMADYRRACAIKGWLSTGKLRESEIGGGLPATHYVKRHIAEEQHGVCSICGMPPLWQGKHIVFILDHINGKSTDNRRGNLRLICPNCDSQLPTYKAKNKGNCQRSSIR